MTSPQTEETFRRSAHLEALDRFVRLRVFVAPAVGVLAAAFAFFEPTPWRRWLLGAVVGSIVLLSYVEWARLRRLGREALNVPLNFMAMIAAQLGMIIATGALFSPLLPVLIVMTWLGAVMLHGSTARLIPFLMVPVFWVLAWAHTQVSLVPAIYGDARAFETGVAPWLAASAYSVMVFASMRIGGTVQSLLAGLFADAVEERDRRLESYAEQTRALSALSAEIAHELKNPLASVKGLGALVAKDVEGKPAERVAVLRREVDRMQDILEELLNFSRPLVPLSMEAVDAVALAEDVVRMHEGSAVDRGVRLGVRGVSGSLSGDPRKLRQVLVNLVQNALHASPAGGAVTITVREDGPSVVIEVDDEGPGLAEDVRGRIFEAGVTTKEDGSGIGLVVARALARQHGGELALDDRDGGGCRAALRLPVEPPAGDDA